MISNLHFENLSVNTNTVLRLIIVQCVGRRVPMGGYRYYLDGESIAIYTNEVEKYSGSTRF